MGLEKARAARTGVRKPLTALQVERARCPEGKAEIYLRDGAARGLELRVKPSSKRWGFRYQFKGTTRVLSLGAFPAMSLAEARAATHEAHSRIAQGIDPFLERQDQQQAVELERQQRETEIARRKTLAQAVSEWLDRDMARRRKDGGAYVRALFERDILPGLGDKPLDAVTKADLVGVFDTIVERGSPTMANIARRSLGQFIEWAMARELLDRDPLQGIKAPGGRESPRERHLTEAEIRELARRLPESGLSDRDQRAVWILLSTGVRVGELTGARWSDIDTEAETWRIPETKSGRPHTVYLSAFALGHLHALKELAGTSEWLLPGRGKTKPVHAAHLVNAFADRQADKPRAPFVAPYVQALALPGGRWTPHDLRRTFATLAGEMGVESDTIEKCLNHAPRSALVRTYQRQQRIPEQRRAWSLVGEHLDVLSKGAARVIVHMVKGRGG